MKRSKRLLGGIIAEEFYIFIIRGTGSVKSHYSVGLQTFLFDDIVKHLLCIIIQFFRLSSDNGIIKNSWVTARQHPGLKERCPIDILAQFLQRIIQQNLLSIKGRFYRSKFLPVYSRFILPCILQRNVMLQFLPAFMILPEFVILILHFGFKICAYSFTDQLAYHRNTS